MPGFVNWWSTCLHTQMPIDYYLHNGRKLLETVTSFKNWITCTCIDAFPGGSNVINVASCHWFNTTSEMVTSVALRKLISPLVCHHSFKVILQNKGVVSVGLLYNMKNLDTLLHHNSETLAKLLILSCNSPTRLLYMAGCLQYKKYHFLLLKHNEVQY